MLSLFAQMAGQGSPFAGWTFGHIIIAIIVIAACVGIMLIACRQFGVQIPPFVWQIAWIVVVAVVAIVAIKFLLGM